MEGYGRNSLGAISFNPSDWLAGWLAPEEAGPAQWVSTLLQGLHRPINKHLSSGKVGIKQLLAASLCSSGPKVPQKDLSCGHSLFALLACLQPSTCLPAKAFSAFLPQQWLLAEQGAGGLCRVLDFHVSSCEGMLSPPQKKKHR